MQRRNGRVISALVFVVMLPACPRASAQQRPASGLAPRIDSIVEAARAARAIPGVAIGVVRGSDTIALRGYGEADVEHHVTVTPETVFHLASISKQFTAAAILRL